jgi:hypothetical protein
VWAGRPPQAAARRAGLDQEPPLLDHPTALRRARANFAAQRRRPKFAELTGQYRSESAKAEAVLVLAHWRYLGFGYQTEGEAWLARSAAADAHERRRIARLELAMA